MGNHPTKHQTTAKNRPKKNVHWKSAEVPSAPGKPFLTTAYDAANDVLAIKWDRPNSDGGSPIIGYLVEHRRVGSPTWTAACQTLLPYPEWPLGNLEPGWRYQFRVIAQNAVGSSDASLFSDPIAVSLQRNATAAPQFIEELRDRIVMENDKCEFRVRVVGSPNAQINWYKDGFEVFSSRRMKIVTENGTSALTIHETTLTDEGEIKCTATNRIGHAATRMQLRIEAPPKIRLPRQYEEGLLVEAGELIKLKVGVAGRPSPSIAWMHNGEIVRNDGRHEITSSDKNSFLKIVRATRSDRGEYNVRAINKLGEFSASFLVTVTAKPSPPTNVRIAMSLGQSVTLMWDAPIDDGGCKIGNYIVEYFRIGWDVWLKAASTRKLTATLNDLIEGSEYKFRVKAESPYGMSEPSEESRILFIPDHRRGIISPSRENAKVDEKQTKKDSAAKTINQIVVPEVPKNVEFLSQIYDSESIAREMNYGAKVDIVYKKKEMSTTNVRSRNNSENERETDNKSDGKRSSKEITKTNLTTPTRAEARSSNEFMLVLYDEDEKVQTNSETNQFDLDLKEAISAPPLSLSVPDLQSLGENDLNRPLKRSSSSTELLYEKAMQRFYQAVKLDEAEMEKKRQKSVERSSSRPRAISPIASSESRGEKVKEIAKANELSDETEEWSEETPTGSAEESMTDTDSIGRDIRQEIVEAQRKRSISKEPLPSALFEDDYTDSTASTPSVSISESVDSMEQFLNSVRSASTSTTNIRGTMNDELETYHPRMDGIRAFSPLRSPEPGQAAIVLSKPSPLPDPYYVPKPILKRSSKENTAIENFIANENNNNDNNQLSTAANQQVVEEIIDIKEQKPTKKDEKPSKKEEKAEKPVKEKSEKRGFLHLFDRKKAPSNENLKKTSTEAIAEPKTATQKKPTLTRMGSTEAEKNKKLQLRQNSMEENKVAIDHYSDLVRELSSRHPVDKPKVPLYMDSGALRAAAERAEWEEKQAVIKSEQDEREAERKRIKAEEEAEERKRLEELTLKLQQFQPPSPKPRSRSNSMQKDLVEISVEQTHSITYSLREIKPNGIQESSLRRSSLEPPTIGADTSSTVVKRNAFVRQRTDPGTSSNRSRSKSPLSQQKTSLTSTVLRVTRLPIEDHLSKIDIHVDDLSRSASPEPFRCRTPDQIQVEAETNVKSTISYLTDVALLLFASWLYFFRDARLAIPVLVLMIYRQLKDAIEEKLQRFKRWKRS